MGGELLNGGFNVLSIDEAYEFSAPRFFDFVNEETEEDIKKSELWFEISRSYPPSPFMPKIKEGRSVQIDSECDFGEVEQSKELNGKVDNSAIMTDNSRVGLDAINVQQNPNDGKMSFEFAPEIQFLDANLPLQGEKSNKKTSFTFPILTPQTDTEGEASSTTSYKSCTSKASSGSNSCTPEANITDKLTCGSVKATSVAKTPCASHSMSITKPNSTTKYTGTGTAKKIAIKNIRQENQAVKRQKLDEGKSRQIHNVKHRVLPHKSKPDSEMVAYSFGSCCNDSTTHNEQVPFVSAAEMVNKFHSNTRETDLSQNSTSCENAATMMHNRPQLKLTRPKEPEFETSHRVRAARIKSSVELEEEMLAKIPKFKARPVNKKILESPSLPLLPRTTPQPFEFQDFNLKTMERAKQHSETSSDSSSQNHDKQNKSTEPGPPHLETSLRARPTKIKSSEELELEELEKLPKFKAKPLNKKILESKGDLGLFVISKPQTTTPQEFHFATDERLGPPLALTDTVDKLSLHSDSSTHSGRHQIPKITTPNPFNLRTEERGLEKERQFTFQIIQKQMEEEKARVPKATPYPYTTDYPVIPPKPEPKPCTKPEGFQLESLIRHEEELQRKMEEKERMEREEAQRRLYKAQPILKEDPIPLPKKERKPLTDVHEFNLHVDHRVVERSEFDKKMKEKEMMYKRLREENEIAKMIEEEKELKQMRREMVPHARPLPNFANPFLPQKSNKDLTEAKSPMLKVKQRVDRCRYHHAFR